MHKFRGRVDQISMTEGEMAERKKANVIDGFIFFCSFKKDLIEGSAPRDVLQRSYAASCSVTASMSFPPIYGGTFSVSQSVTSLPAYTARDRPSTAGAVRELTEHVFEIKDKKKKVWATLKLRSTARAPTSLPTFLEGDNITGSVTLDLPHSEKILGVSILVCVFVRNVQCKFKWFWRRSAG